MLIRLLTIIFISFPFMLSAQDNWTHIKVVDEQKHHPDSVMVDFHDSHEFSQKQLERAMPSLKPDYTGYAIELITSDHILDSNNAAFSDFGRIYMAQSSNKYHYLFLIDYHRRKSVKQFYRKIVKPKAPNSKVVQYLNGVKTTEFSW